MFGFAAAPAAEVADSVAWQAGFSRLDITPEEPVRLAGYGSRKTPSEGIETPLHVRCMVLRQAAETTPAALLLSIDTIGLPGALTKQLAAEIEKEYQIPRKRIAICSTHTHAAPDLVSELSNIFAVPLTPAERAAGERYKAQLLRQAVQSVAAALSQQQPVQLAYAQGEVGFAANRRLLRDGKWVGFGVQPDGPVDHRVPTLRIVDADGTVRGVVFNYACHCTTLGGDYNRVNAEWAGYACRSLEAAHPDCVALCTIGCGADANPEPRGTLEAAKVHGRTLAAEVERVLSGAMQPVDQPLEVRFDYAALAFDLPSIEELHRRAESSNPQEARHAEHFLDVYQRHRRLPANYPVPIQSWQFGDDLTMLFLGGEVVVDYALRLQEVFGDSDLWVTAYANDVLGYIASERMREEGGYEFDRSAIYYNLPGPWASGTEAHLIEQVEKLVESSGRPEPLSAAESLQRLSLSDPQMEIELVAAEPLVVDPVNLAFDDDGRLWVVEMGDYPLGEKQGRIKTLEDTDGDGRYDQATLFLDGLAFPTGVLPWRDGVLITAAPDVLFARDLDGDGRADEVQTRYTGFRLANPQHRINGFAYGLDHALQLASGDNLGEITSATTGATINASGKDVKIWPDSGELAAISGRTQYVRARNDWGEWFGNNNSRPMYQFPIAERYLARNPHVAYASNQAQLFEPAVAPPVFPKTSADERFNDLHAANRFTSACSSIVARSPVFDFPDGEAAFVCEPVHNLVHRAKLLPVGPTYRAVRDSQEETNEFLASSDPWFRPVRAAVGPDGALWVVDMYREVIEHPEWIPESWQQRLNLRAGERRGRIYRIQPKAAAAAEKATGWPLKESGDAGQTYLAWLRSPIGSLRDLAQQHLIETFEAQPDPTLVAALAAMAGEGNAPASRVHALAILAHVDRLDDALLTQALHAEHGGLVRVAMRLAEPRLDRNASLVSAVAALVAHADPRVVLQATLTLGESDQSAAGEALAQLAIQPELDRWIQDALRSSASPHAETIVTALLHQVDDATQPLSEPRLELLADLLVTARHGGTDLAPFVETTFASSSRPVADQLLLAKTFLRVFRDTGLDLASLSSLFSPLYRRAMEVAEDDDQPAALRCSALELTGIGLGDAPREEALLLDLLQPAVPPSVQQQALDRLIRDDHVARFAAILEAWPAMTTSVRSHCVSRILARRPWSERLVDALAAGTIRLAEISTAAQQQLLQTGSPQTQKRMQELIGSGSQPDKEALVAKYLATITGPADAAKGKAHFQQHCAVCHQPPDGSRAVGANLNNLSSVDPAKLLQAILDPNRALEPAFQRYIVQTVDDRILVGAIEQEVGSSLTLAAADGKRTTLQRNEIVSLKNTGTSLMPEGFEAVLDEDQMRDLIRYLQERTAAAGSNP